VNIYINYLIARRALELSYLRDPLDEYVTLRGIERKNYLWALNSDECNYLIGLIEEYPEYQDRKADMKIMLEKLALAKTPSNPCGEIFL